MKIFNGTNCKVMVNVDGFGRSTGGKILLSYACTRSLYGDKLFEPKEFIIAYAHNSSKINQRVISFNKRQKLDRLLHDEEQFVEIEDGEIFAEKVFQYRSSSSYISSVKFTTKVSVSQQSVIKT